MPFSIDFANDWLADLHLHSRYSRATSPAGDLVAIGASARWKGIHLIGTGDCLHPAWMRELRANLVERAEGFFEPAPALARAMERIVRDRLSDAEESRFRVPRFVLQTEVSTLFRSAGKGRRVHHVVLVSSWGGVERMTQRLGRYGRMESDGRPILRLSARDMVSEVLDADAGAVIIPAHIWTPWHSLLGARLGFDSVEACFGDMADRIWALETGLSADPAMLGRVSHLDRFQAVSSSDAHSPDGIGREATVFRGICDFPGLREALRTGEGLVGTLEFFPEAGKYHADGHRRCGVCWMPEETRRWGGRCRVCGKAVTRGVLSRVEELADRRPAQALCRRTFLRLLPLKTVIRLMCGASERSRRVNALYGRVVAWAGPELRLLVEGMGPSWGSGEERELAGVLEAVRKGFLRIEPGYDGVFGRVHWGR